MCYGLVKLFLFADPLWNLNTRNSGKVTAPWQANDGDVIPKSAKLAAFIWRV